MQILAARTLSALCTLMPKAIDHVCQARPLPGNNSVAAQNHRSCVLVKPCTVAHLILMLTKGNRETSGVAAAALASMLPHPDVLCSISDPRMLDWMLNQFEQASSIPVEGPSSWLISTAVSEHAEPPRAGCESTRHSRQADSRSNCIDDIAARVTLLAGAMEYNMDRIPSMKHVIQAVQISLALLEVRQTAGCSAVNSVQTSSVL